jgi:hypothetical protein
MPVRTPRCRPRLEALEQRWMPRGPTTVFWSSAIDGSWNDAESWSTGQVPGAADDVTIRSGVVVTSTGNFNAAHSLTCNGGLVVAGGVLALGQPSTVSDLTVSGGVLQATNGVTVTDSFSWSGGQLAGTSADLFGTASITGQPDSDDFLNGIVLNNHANLTWSSGAISSDGGEIHNLSGGTFLVTGSAAFTDAPFFNLGRLTISVPDAVEFDSIDTSGGVELQGGSLQAATFVQTAGQTQIEGATLGVQLVELQGGLLTGYGRIEGSLDSHGQVAPSGGQLFVVGDYDQASDGVLTLLVGTTPDLSSYGGDPPPSAPLVVYGQATLAGTLEAQPAPGVQPAAGDLYEGLSAAPRQGQFDVVDAWSDDRSGLRLTVVYGDASVDLLVEQFATPVVPPPPDTPAVPPVDTPAPPSPPSDPTPAPASPVPRTTTTTTTTTSSDPTLANAQRLILPGGPTALPGSPGGAAAPGGPAGATPGIGRGAPQGPPQGPQNGGGARPPAEQGRPADAGPQAAGRVPTIGGPMGGKMGAAEQTESSGLADELFATFPLALPEIELPSANELLSTADLAAALVVGVRPRANLVPQQSGSQLSGVATLLTSEDGGEREADVSPFAGLFISPLTGSAGRPIGTEELTQADPAEEAPVPQGEAPRRTVAVAVTAALAAGAAGAASVGDRRARRAALGRPWR